MHSSLEYTNVHEFSQKSKMNVISYVSLWYFALLSRFKSEPDVVKY